MDSESTSQGERENMAKAHPGFKAVAASIQSKYPGEPGAGARILAAASRGASAKAKKKNPRLKRVKAAKFKHPRSAGPHPY